MRDVLKDVRRPLVAMLNFGLIEPDAVTENHVSNFLKLCQGLPILADGFQDISTNLAEQNDLLTVWAQVLRQSDFYRYLRDTVYWRLQHHVLASQNVVFQNIVTQTTLYICIVQGLSCPKKRREGNLSCKSAAKLFL